MEKLLSIIIPVYNNIKVKDAIISVLKYKTENCELLVIDGNSTDGTKELLQKYISKIDVCISEKDKGVHDALNKGIRMAKGEWVFCLAADDILIYDPAFILDEKLGNDDLICGNIIEEYQRGKYRIAASNPNLKMLDYNCSIRHPATFFRRKLFEKYGLYNENIKCAGDREIFLRFRNNGAKFKIIDKNIVLFRYGGLSTANPMKYGYKDDIAISNQYKVNKIKTYSYFLKRSFKYLAGKLLRKLRLKRDRCLDYREVLSLIEAQNNGNIKH